MVAVFTMVVVAMVVAMAVMVMRVWQVTHEDGEIIYSQGDETSVFHIVKTGTVSGAKLNADGSEDASTFASGSFFCESALLASEPAGMTYSVEGGQVRLMRLTRATFESELGPLRTIIEAEASRYRRQHSTAIILIMRSFAHPPQPRRCARAPPPRSARTACCHSTLAPPLLAPPPLAPPPLASRLGRRR